MTYLWIDYENLALWDSKFSVTQLIGVSVSKSSVERVVILWEEFPNILHISFVNLFLSQFTLLVFKHSLKKKQESKFYLQTGDLEFVRCPSYHYKAVIKYMSKRMRDHHLLMN